MVFVLGCPRSGTTFTAESIGAAPGFLDLGEVPRLKAAIPALYDDGREAAVVTELRRLLRRSQRLACAAGQRAVEQTPEAVYVIPQLAAAFPDAQFVHLIRDGRDVVASLLEKGWLSGGGGPGGTVDHIGRPLGGHARFWVEPDRVAEFEASSDARRGAWAWRRYESTAAEHLQELDPRRVAHVRYEDLAAAPLDIAAALAQTLGVGDSEAFVRAFDGMHAESVGRYRDVLTDEQVADVEAEAGPLLRALGHLDAPGR
jgi:hypothetical protein